MIVEALIVALGLVNEPATAITSPYAMSTDARVLYLGCQSHTLSFSTPTPAESTTWDLSIVDDLSQSVAMIHATGAAGSSDFVLCGDEDRTGRYDVYGSFEQCDIGGTDCVRSDVQYSFQVRGAHTEVGVAATTTRPRFDAVVTFTMRCAIEAPDGYVGLDGARVRLEVLVAHRWRRLGSSEAVADNRGTAKKSYRWNVRGPVRVRTVCQVRSGISRKEKSSAPVTVRSR